MEKEFLLKSVEAARAGVAAGHGGPFGAVVVKDGKIVGTGHNMVLATNDCTAHAEVLAIRAACNTLNTFDLSGCTLYTSCYPCPMCMGACLWSRVNGIIYAATATDAANTGFDDKAFHDFLKNPKSDEYRKLEQVEIEGMLTPFEEWHNKKSKIPY